MDNTAAKGGPNVEHFCEAQPRFQLIDDDGLTQFIDSADSENTKKQIKYSVSVFNDFCKQADATNYDDIDVTALDVLLSKFYAGARNKKGQLYSKKSMQSIRFGLQRHFFTKRGMDIIKGKEFTVSNKVFKALLVKLKSEGKSSVKRHPTVNKEDMDLIQASLDISTARGLLQKVFIDVMVYFANRGMENLRAMKPVDFVLNTDTNNNREYFTLRDMGTKNHSTDDEASQGGRMYDVKGSPRCPVATLKKYLDRIHPECPFMWQRPKAKVHENDTIWFDKSPIGRDSLSNMMKKISLASGCSKVYTNHCLRATTCTLLDHSGCASRDIMSVSGHRSETSIKYYVRTSDAKKEEMSDIISSTLQARPSTVSYSETAGPSSVAVGVGHSTEDNSAVPVGHDSDLEVEPLSLSQVDQMLSEISKPGNNILQDVSNVCNTISAQNRPAAYTFNSCMVNIYNK
jgi:hypothetical protein